MSLLQQRLDHVLHRYSRDAHAPNIAHGGASLRRVHGGFVVGVRHEAAGRHADAALALGRVPEHGCVEHLIECGPKEG